MFTSHAQNFEDVILRRALKDVAHGFYIDIGANDPDFHSISNAFHERGWRGISAEPEPEFAERLRLARPGETVIEGAIGPTTDATFYSISGTGLSTCDREVATAHAQAHDVVVRDVKALTLDHVLEMANDQVHWLKVDVEGFEEAVISSWKTSKKRPWIIVIESVDPVTKQRKVNGYRASLVQKGYSFVYFDGLNDFYVHQDHADLIGRFGAPPNVFDEFVFAEDSDFCYLANVRRRSEVARLHAEITNTQAELANTRTEHANTQVKLANAQAQLANTQAELANTQAKLTIRKTELPQIRRSRWWHITARLQMTLSAVASWTANFVRIRYPRLYDRIAANPTARKARALAITTVSLPAEFDRRGLGEEGQAFLPAEGAGTSILPLFLDRMQPWTFGVRLDG